MEAKQVSRHGDAEAGGNHSGRWGPGKTVGVIGGKGQMGQLFGRLFAAAGYEVILADRDSEKGNEEAIKLSDIVLFAVPLHDTVNIIRDLVAHVRPDQLLMDLSSLKVGPIEAMLLSPAAVVGLHPMFGGSVSSFAGQTIVACPVRIAQPEWLTLRELFENRGMRVKECPPEKHDCLMSIIQVLFHVTTMLTGRVLREMEVDVAETMDFTSPSYRLEMNLLGRMFAQNATLYSAITQMNPYALKVLDHLGKGLESYKEWYLAADFQAFVEDFKKSAEHLGDFSTTAFQESSALLDFAAKLVCPEAGEPVLPPKRSCPKTT
jgi:prephenate dehydrogenase